MRLITDSVQFSCSAVPTLCDPMDCSTPGSLSIHNSWSLLKLMSIKSVMPSNHLILCRPLLLLPSVFPSLRVFSNESALRIRWPKNWCFWTVVLETLESPLDCKEIHPVHSEGEPWDYFGRNDAKAETPVLWPPHAKSWLIGKDCDAGRDWGQEEKGMTEDEMAGWHHWLDGCESEWTLGVDDGQGGLVCWDSWGRKESDSTERLISLI